jgi:hypothetical protein
MVGATMMGDVNVSSRAHSFDVAAAQYAASRPSYPAALFDVPWMTVTPTLVTTVGLDEGSPRASSCERNCCSPSGWPGTEGGVIETVYDVPHEHLLGN